MSEFKKLLEEIKEKPALYLGEKSITNLYIFLQGYGFARRQLNIPLLAEEKVFRNFQPWLQERLNLQTSQSWSKMILSTYPNEDAFARFFDLWREFEQEQLEEKGETESEQISYAKRELALSI